MKRLNPLFCFLLVIAGTLFGCNNGTNSVRHNQGEVKTKNTDRSVYLVDVPGVEIAFLTGYDSGTNKFGKYYVFQYDTPSTLLDISKVLHSDFVEFNASSLKILIENTVTVFTIDDNYKALKGEQVYYGYGLSERSAPDSYYQLVNHGNDIHEISEIIQVNDKSTAGGKECNSGGTGASSCSVSGIVGTYQVECSVTCAKGYACCKEDAYVCGCIQIEEGGRVVTAKSSKAILALTKMQQ